MVVLKKHRGLFGIGFTLALVPVEWRVSPKQSSTVCVSYEELNLWQKATTKLVGGTTPR